MMDHVFTEKLFPILPGNNKIAINISSAVPAEILNRINNNNINDNVDTVVLYNQDVWRYFDFENEIFDRLKNKNVIITTFGYTSERRNDNKWIVSFPITYFNRKILDYTIKESDLSVGFSCLNYRPALHRLLLGYKLYKSDLLKHIIFTQHWDETVRLGPGDQIELEKIPNFEEYKKILPIVFHSSDIPKSKDNFSAWMLELNHPAYSNAYCNIITETEMCEIPFKRNINLPIVSEKSFKPFISYQIPIFCAAKNHIQYLNSLGFECMESLLPIGYDQFEVNDKINAIADVVSRGTRYIKDFYFSHIKEIEHNAELVRSDKVEKIILQQIKDIMIKDEKF